MRLFGFLVLLLCAPFVFAGCGYSGLDQPTTVVAPALGPIDFGSRWLAGVNCGRGCWEGIQPGRTSYSSAKQVLMVHPLIAAGTSLEPVLGSIGWNMADQAIATIGLSGPNAEAIQFVHVRFLSESYPLADVFQMLGEPDYVDAWVDIVNVEHPERKFSLTYIFSAQGAAVTLAVPRGQRPDDGPSARYAELLLFVPGLDSYVQARWGRSLNPFGGKSISRWIGHRGFGYYCRPIVDGATCLP